jgi:ABC-type proline/glycine betaine transport system ATPase subunit
MSDDSVIAGAQTQANPLLIDYHVALAQDFSGADAQRVLIAFAQIMNKIIGVALAGEKFTAANPVIQHSMQAAASLEIGAATLQQQLQQQSGIISPFAQPGPRRMN